MVKWICGALCVLGLIGILWFTSLSLIEQILVLVLAVVVFILGGVCYKWLQG